MNSQKLLYIISQAPYSNSTGQEALDAILIGASFEQHISVLFLHDGVFQVKSHQQVESHQRVESHQQKTSHEQNNSYQRTTNKESSDGLKQYTKTYQALVDFDVKDLFVLGSSLDARGLSLADLIIKPTRLDEMQVSKLISNQYRVFTF